MKILTSSILILLPITSFSARFKGFLSFLKESNSTQDFRIDTRFSRNNSGPREKAAACRRPAGRPSPVFCLVVAGALGLSTRSRCHFSRSLSCFIMIYRSVALLSALSAVAGKSVELPTGDIAASSKLGSRILSQVSPELRSI